MTRNARFFGSFLSFFRSLVAPFFCIWGFPGRKIPHCVAFECSSQAKTKQDPKLRFLASQKINSLARAWIHAIARSSLPKDSRLRSEPLATYHIDYKANFWGLVNKWSGLFFPFCFRSTILWGILSRLRILICCVVICKPIALLIRSHGRDVFVCVCACRYQAVCIITICCEQ